MAEYYAQIKPGDNLSGVDIKISSKVVYPGGLVGQTVLETDKGYSINESSGGGYYSLILEDPDEIEVSLYNYSNDGEPPVFDTLPEDMGTVVYVNEGAPTYPYLLRLVNSKIYGHTEDFSLVDITELKRNRVTRSGSDSNTVKVGTVNCPTVAEFFIISDTEFFCDIKLTGSIKYTPGSGLMDSAEITIPIIPGWLEAGESITARNISIVAREDGAAFNYILVPYDVRYADGEVSFYVKGYKPNDTISGTAKTVATYINVHIAGLFIPAS